MEQESEQVADLMKISRSLEGTTRHASTHAAGVVISPAPLVDFMPVFKTSSNEITTQYPMKDIEKLGLLKMDFLGLRTLTVINNTQTQIRKNHVSDFDISTIPLDDAETFRLLCEARTQGVFQLESTGMRDLIRKMKPSDFHDIIALVALFRPGPIQSGMADQYVRRKHGHEKVTFDFAELEPILGETYGVPVYQEQVMKISNALSGFSLGQADSLRKAMGKKDMEIMSGIEEQFVNGAVANGHDQAKITTLWTQLAKFGEYRFNTSHSACYALVAYQTAYLKAHYSAEYMAALISSEVDNTDKVIRYIQECRERKIKVTPPDINESMGDFTVAEGAIRFGLSAIKGMGQAAAKAIIDAREQNGKFGGLSDFAQNAGPAALNKRALEGLVKCGAFDYTGKSRQAVFDSLEEALGRAQKAQHDREVGQFNMVGQAGGDTGETAVESITDKEEWPEKTLLAYEKEALGFYISGHPLNEHAKDLRRLATYNTATIAKAPNKAEVHIGGMVISKKVKSTKKGDRMAYLNLEDLHGSIEALVWPDIYSKYIDLIEGEEPIFIKGTADVDDEKGVKIITQEILTIPQAREKFTNSVHVRIATPGLEPETLRELKDIFSRRCGTCSVILHFKVPGQAELDMRVGNAKVTANDNLIEEIETLLGEQSVFLE